MRERLGRPSTATGDSLAVARHDERAGWGELGATYTMPRLPADSTGSPDLGDRPAHDQGRPRRRVWDMLVAKRQPAGERQEGGGSGGALHAAMVEEFDGMTVLVGRCRYSAESNAPLRGRCHVPSSAGLRRRYSAESNAPLRGLGILAPGRVDGGGDGAGRMVLAETDLRNMGGGDALAGTYAQIGKVGAEVPPSPHAADMDLPRGRDMDALERLFQGTGRADPAHFRTGAIFGAARWSGLHLGSGGRRHAGGDPDAAVDLAATAKLGALARATYLRVGALA